MGKDGHIAGDHEIEEEILQLRRRRMVRRLDQDVARIGDGKQAAGAQAGDEIRAHVDVGAGDQPQRNCLAVEDVLQLDSGLPDRRTGIMVKAR
jgi:hypothetical protein